MNTQVTVMSVIVFKPAPFQMNSCDWPETNQVHDWLKSFLTLFSCPLSNSVYGSVCFVMFPHSLLQVFPLIHQLSVNLKVFFLIDFVAMLLFLSMTCPRSQVLVRLYKEYLVQRWEMEIGMTDLSPRPESDSKPCCVLYMFVETISARRILPTWPYWQKLLFMLDFFYSHLNNR